jgi:hypothetical protein
MSALVSCTNDMKFYQRSLLARGYLYGNEAGIIRKGQSEQASKLEKGAKRMDVYSCAKSDDNLVISSGRVLRAVRVG